MPTHIFEPSVSQVIADAQQAARDRRTKPVVVEGQTRQVRTPFPSPGDWRDRWIYFLMIDRFNNPAQPPAGVWNRRFDFRQGGTFEGVRTQLGYLAQLGVKAIWLSPVLKNAKPNRGFGYHGYGQQDFMNVDERFASDGQRATAERELAALIDEAHARDMLVVLDIVLNHSARVFDYVRPEGVVDRFVDPAVMNGPLGSEPAVDWLNGFGWPRSDWRNRLDPPSQLHPDDAVWPSDLQNHLFFRRRGTKLNDEPDAGGFVRGDFDDMRQLVVEYGATDDESLRSRYGVMPVLSILIRAHHYLMARYDFDGFRIDTVKYVHPEAMETFGNSMREFALTLGKTNFFTFGEVYDDEKTIAQFTGRNGGSGEGFGIDAALDFPLFFTLPGVAKGLTDVAEIRRVFADRKAQEAELLSSHGEAGRFFVSFLDNHDQHQRIQHPATPHAQISLALALLFTLQGIPSIYYGTEQGLQGTVKSDGSPDLTGNESSREALWGKPNAFSTTGDAFVQIQALSRLRQQEPPLSYGRLYFREASGNGRDFGHSSSRGGIVAFSRILVDREINATPRRMRVAYSNLGTNGAGTVRRIQNATFHAAGQVTAGTATALDVILAPSEVQVLAPA